MDEALSQPMAAQLRSTQYRDGLLLAFLSLWPIRRRSLASLTVTRHVEFDTPGATILLHPEDTKSKRAEAFRLPEPLAPYLRRYVDEIRRHLLGGTEHDGLWVSRKGGALSGGRIYDIVRARVREKFGKDMCLHDFRRSAATFLAMDAPEKIGLIPGTLQHTSPNVSEQHYNLARSMKASQRHSAAIANMRAELNPRARAEKG
jgi:integrase